MGQCASHRRVASANSPSLETTSPSTSRRADHLNVASTISCASRQKTADATFQTKIPPSAADRRKFVSSLPLLEVPPVQTSKVGSTYQKHDVSSHWCPPSDLRFSLQKSKPTLALSHQHLERPPHELLNSEQTRRYPRCDSQPPHPAHQRNEAPNAELKMPTDNTDAHHAIARTCLHPDKHLLRDTSSTLFRDASISLTSVCTCDRSEKVPISTGDYPEAATCYRTPLFKSQLLAARPASAATSHLTQDANLSYHTSRSHRNEMVARLALEGGLHRTFSEASSEASSSYDPMTKMRNERTREVTERDQQVIIYRQRGTCRSKLAMSHALISYVKFGMRNQHPSQLSKQSGSQCSRSLKTPMSNHFQRIESCVACDALLHADVYFFNIVCR